MFQAFEPISKVPSKAEAKPSRSAQLPGLISEKKNQLQKLDAEIRSIGFTPSPQAKQKRAALTQQKATLDQELRSLLAESLREQPMAKAMDVLSKLGRDIGEFSSQVGKNIKD